MPNFVCSAILFDLDGVLVDSTKSVDRQWRRWAIDNHLDPETVTSVAHGVRTIEVVRRFAPHLPAEEETLKLEAREADDREGVEVMPGADSLLKSIPTDRWCVVTSGTRKLAVSRLQLAQLPTPRVLVAADDVSKGKPDPEPYLKGAELLGIEPTECIVIEDAPAGIRSAHAGRMKAIALPSTFSAAQLQEADGIVKSLSDIQIKCKDGKLEVTL
jgi:sugar-phosphatase